TSEMHRLIQEDPRNQECIFPYLGGEEINDSPSHAHNRYVINFGELSEIEARRWPALFGILEQKVKPERSTKDPKKYPRMVNEWWKFWNFRVELERAAKGKSRVLVISRHTEYLAFAFVPSYVVCSDAVN